MYKKDVNKVIKELLFTINLFAHYNKVENYEFKIERKSIVD